MEEVVARAYGVGSLIGPAKFVYGLNSDDVPRLMRGSLDDGSLASKESLNIGSQSQSSGSHGSKLR